MTTDITRDFNGAEEKGLKVFYNDDLGTFEVEAGTEVLSFYDEENEAGDGSNGKAEAEVKKFIEEFELEL